MEDQDGGNQKGRGEGCSFATVVSIAKRSLLESPVVAVAIDTSAAAAAAAVTAVDSFTFLLRQYGTCLFSIGCLSLLPIVALVIHIFTSKDTPRAHRPLLTNKCVFIPN